MALFWNTGCIWYQYMSGLTDPAPPRLAVRTDTGKFDPGWLGIAGRAGNSWPGMDAEFITSYIYGCLLFFESRVGTSPLY